MTNPGLSQIYATLRSVGLTRGQVVKLLPDWWDPEVGQTEAGLRETALLLGRRLNLDATALLKGRAAPVHEAPPVRYKHTVRVTAEHLQPATLIASALAKAIVSAMPSGAGQLASSPAEIRADLLAKSGGTSVDFDSLLAYCWGRGVPVIPLPNLPAGIRKMDAAAMRIGSRPAIIISLRANSKAWLSFLLAHELGHLCLQHVSNNSALIEGSLRDSSEFDAESQHDSQELEANEFAHALLAGPEADAEIASWSTTLPPITIATHAIDAAGRLETAAGHLILRYAFKTGRWPQARNGLNFLEEDQDPQSSMVAWIERTIDASLVGEDLQDYIAKVTGVGLAD